MLVKQEFEFRSWKSEPIENAVPAINTPCPVTITKVPHTFIVKARCITGTRFAIVGKTRAMIAKNKSKVRAYLTEDPTNWPRDCVIRYPSKFERSIDLLHDAAKAAVVGEQGRAESKYLISQMDDLEMRSWFDEMAQNAGKVRLEILGRKPKAPIGRSSNKRPSKREELPIITRDGFHCRYCGIRIVPNEQLKKLQKIVGYETLPDRSQALRRTKNTDIHGIWLLTRATVDHVEPVSRGGPDVNREENLVACCWPCNYAKWSYTIQDLELDHPGEQSAKINDWCGLMDFLP